MKFEILHRIVDALHQKQQASPESKNKQDPFEGRLCVIDTVASFVDSISPDLDFSQQRQELNEDRKQFSIQLNTSHQQRMSSLQKKYAQLIEIDHPTNFPKKMRERERHETAVHRLDRMYIRNLYTKIFSDLSQETGKQYDLQFIHTDSSSDASNYIDQGYQVAVMIHELFGSLHIFHLGKDDQSQLIDRSSRTPIVGIENKDTRVVNQKGLDSAMHDHRREVTQNDKYPSSYWNTVIVKER